MTSGPFHTEREALAASLYHQHARALNTEVPTASLNLTDLIAALAGVQLGDWDKRIVEWLADWEPSTVAVVSGLITRARATALPRADHATILAALDQAADYKRDRAANCADCTDQSCDTCQYRLQTAHAYDGVAARLQRAREATSAGPPTAPGGFSQSSGSDAGTATPESREPEAGR